MVRASKPSKGSELRWPETSPVTFETFGSFGGFRDFWVVFSPPTLRFDPQGLSRIVGGSLVNDLGPVWWPEVAGGASSRPENLVRRGGGLRVSRGAKGTGWGFSLLFLKTLDPTTLNSNFPKLKSRLP